MNCDDGVKLVFAHVENHSLPKIAGHADDSIDRTPGVHRSRHNVGRSLELRYVAGNGKSGTARRPNFPDNSVRHLARRIGSVHGHAVVGHQYSSTLLGTEQRYGAAYPVATAGDGDDFALEERAHIA